MPLLPRLNSLWRNLFRKARKEQELTEEIDAYLEMLIDLKIKEGFDPEEARRAALIELGGREQVKEKVREARMGHHLESLWQDVRYGVRNLRKHSLLSTVVIVTLTLGIGISAGVFTLINAFLLRARVDKDPPSFVRVYSAYSIDPARPGYPSATTLEDYLAYRDRARSLRDVAAWAKFEAPLGDDDSSEVRSLFVSCNFFSLYDPEQPILGRLLQPADCAADSPVAVVSEQLWRSRFEADPQIIGKVVHLNGQPVTIIGVTQAFAGQIDEANIWVPYALQTYLRRGDELLRPGAAAWLTVEGRLQPGFTRREVAAELTLLAGQQDSLHPGRKTTVTVTNGSEFQKPNFSSTGVWMISLILGLLTCVVLLACANVTTLRLARADERRQEIAVRLALGAGRMRLLRMLLVETLLLAAAAGFASLYFAYHLPGILMGWLGDSQSGLTDRTLQPDWRVFAYLTALTLLAGVLAGLAPALQSLRVNLSETIKGRQSMFSGSSGGARLRGLLVCAQVALSLVLLVGAGFFVRASQRMSGADPGYETRQVIWAMIRSRGGIVLGELPSQPSSSDFHRVLAQRLEALSGVQSVAFANFLPPPEGKGRILSEVQVPGQPGRQAAIKKVSSGFFATLGIPLVNGRALREGDPPCGRSICPVVVSEGLARQFWPGGNPLGMELSDPSGARFEVVGVARDVSTHRLGDRNDPILYLPWDSNPSPTSYLPLVRFTGDSAMLTRAINATFRSMLPGFSLETRTIQSRIDENVEFFRKLETLITLLGAIAVALAVIGIYGVVSFSVSRRTKEMGIRIALGGRSKDIYGAVLGASVRPVAVGLLVGLSLAWAGGMMLARGLQRAPIRVNTGDPLVFAAAAALLAAVALAAMLVPARRATRVDPMLALREE